MAIAATTHHAGFHPLARLTELYTAFKAAQKRRAAYDETVAELNKLSDRELMDLGFSRYDIERVAYDHVYSV